MGLISKIEQIIKQRRRNSDIESKASPLDDEAIRLINLYSKRIVDAKRKTTGSGAILPLSTLRPDYRLDISKNPKFDGQFLMMKNFLLRNSDYKTRSAEKIREFYELKKL